MLFLLSDECFRDLWHNFSKEETAELIKCLQTKMEKVASVFWTYQQMNWWKKERDSSFTIKLCDLSPAVHDKMNHWHPPSRPVTPTGRKSNVNISPQPSGVKTPTWTTMQFNSPPSLGVPAALSHIGFYMLTSFIFVLFCHWTLRFLLIFLSVNSECPTIDHQRCNKKKYCLWPFPYRKSTLFASHLAGNDYIKISCFQR